MAGAIYATLGRQSGLMREMSVIAQNIANASTTGYRAEALVFSEHVAASGHGAPSISMATANGRLLDLAQGGLEQTGGAWDLAIEGEGFFLVDVDGTPHLTRAGAFLPGPDGVVTTADGHALLDDGGAPLALPADAGEVRIAPDGTVSADGRPVGRVGLVAPDDPGGLNRRAGTLFAAEEWGPVADPRIVQGFLEASNVDPVLQVARMVEVQNAYQAGQGFMDREDERARSILRLMDR